MAQLRDVSARGDAVKNGRTLPEQDSGLPALVSDPGLPRMISTVL
ncbi:putative resolvase (plasmid) [Shigella boydii CDC 3083-94]|uniref:Resolvase n=3 Tax=Shigella TaxID=620 RepID=B2TSL1_SHIB3|nr:putative resolvase [Shigella boydii CDC 3083-94]EFW59380.1 Putative resolvase [Shigella flexneri CDC 796-83]EIQ34060.1 immunoglobulin-binding regulator A [Shigella boydii 4444-74]